MKLVLSQKCFTDTLTLKSIGGTTTNAVVTISGVNDAASISGAATGTVQEDGTPTATGTLAVSDVDTGEAVPAGLALKPCSGIR